MGTRAAQPPAPTLDLEHRLTARAAFVECFLTVASHDPLPAAAAHDAYERIASALVAERVEAIAERIYGTLEVKDEVLAARRRALESRGLDAGLPFTYVEGTPAAGGAFAGVQVWGVHTRGRRPAVVRAPGGRLWHGPSFKVLHLASVHGRAGDGKEAQTQQMFAAAARAAAASDLSYASTVRTWIYVRRLLEWYGVLNRVRTELYRTYDFTLPASTGIQGTGGPEECLMDALLADGVPTTTIDRSSRQGPASAYGSSFSRARTLDYEGGRTVYVSGTASIDPGGKSVHEGDPAAQLLETLLDVGAVLAEAGMTLADIVQATLFCKDARTWAACRQVPALLGIPRLPTVCVIADVCREELLVEMEAVASR